MVSRMRAWYRSPLSVPGTLASAADHRGRLRRRGSLRDPAGRLLQMDQTTLWRRPSHLPHGALTFALRTRRVVGDASYAAFCADRHDRGTRGSFAGADDASVAGLASGRSDAAEQQQSGGTVVGF